MFKFFHQKFLISEKAIFRASWMELAEDSKNFIIRKISKFDFQRYHVIW